MTDDQSTAGEVVTVPNAAIRVMNEQAEDVGIWFVAQTATEAYLQQELRRLHEAIEGKTSEECAIAALSTTPAPASPAQAVDGKGAAEAVAAAYDPSAEMARSYGSNYKPHSDGFNTFRMLAEYFDQMAAKERRGSRHSRSGPGLTEARRIVNEQAEDAGLWFVAQYASEAYLQRELRKLHAAVERDNHGTR